MKKDLAHLREEYKRAALDEEHLAADPFQQFADWFEQADASGIHEPNAFSLATANAASAPTIRTVLLKYFDREGFVFFTNYTSRKAQQIDENPQAAMLFPWIDLERQAIIEGTVEKVTRAESLRYFTSRPHGSQIGAWVSNQSEVITSRKLLLMKFEELKRKFKAGEVPIPDFWGGFRIRPHRFEFWQGRENRLHDRFQYTREGEEWKVDRLAP
jgi:pyridoxamine 5'-phosphate oxidase